MTATKTDLTVYAVGPALAKEINDAPRNWFLNEPIKLETSEGTWYLKKILDRGNFATTEIVVALGSFYNAGHDLEKATFEFSKGHRNHVGTLKFH